MQIVRVERDSDQRMQFAKMLVILLGIGVFCVAVSSFPTASLTLGYVAIVCFGIFLSPRMTLAMPRSKFAISFADALIFLTFLLYGGQAAIVLAIFETGASCYYLRNRGFPFGKLMIETNVSLSAITTGITFLVFILLKSYFFSGLDISQTHHLITVVGCLAASQFISSSFIAATFQSIKHGGKIWHIWKSDCFSSSMSQIVGAGLAGLIYKLINFGDAVTGLVAFTALAIAYLNYRSSISEINQAIADVEEAEKAKAETERIRRHEAERHSAQLVDSLTKEERANAALRKSEKDLTYAALHDALTGLANRKYLNDILRQLIDKYKEDPSSTFQVLFLDIRSFKDINDTLGHTIGDKVLSIAAKRFARLVNSGDTVARIGGDEFAIVLRNLSSPGKAQKVARRIYESITRPFSLGGHNINIDLNIGIAPCDAEYDSPEEILRDADIAMHHAKEKKNGLAIFTKELRARFLERVQFEMDLRHALDRNELSLNYQPIVSLTDGRIVGFEALLRWQHSEFGSIPPNRFIPIAEDSGLIQPITVWILDESARQVALWQKISPEYRNLMVSVNISGKHLSNDDLIDDVETALYASKIDPASLKLEITESSAMENAEHTIALLNRLKNLGVLLSMDDFGTGYSSLSYLQRLPFDTLKIDRSFVFGVGENGENSEILQTIISLAKNLKMRVIAEGIETEAQFSVLQNLGCDYGQGYLLGKPKRAEDAERLLYEHQSLLPAGPAERFTPEHSYIQTTNLPLN
jgi:diguanylate cyclase (GGDEF)-like protein